MTRRRAISILGKCTRTEGGWDPLGTYKVAQRVVDIEEEDLLDVRSCENVPFWARIPKVSARFDPIERRAILTYTRTGIEHDLGGYTIEEVIDW